MNDLVIRIIFAIVLFGLYFVIAYFVAVKAFDASQYKWLVITLLQVGSLFSIKYLTPVVGKLEFAKGWDDNTLLRNTFLMLLAANALVLIIMNFIFMIREISLFRKKRADYKKVTTSSLSSNIKNMSTSGKRTSLEEEEQLLGQIENIIEDGRYNEAVKALREFVSYAKNQTTVDRATLMMRRLQTTMERND